MFAVTHRHEPNGAGGFRAFTGNTRKPSRHVRRPSYRDRMRRGRQTLTLSGVAGLALLTGCGGPAAGPHSIAQRQLRGVPEAMATVGPPVADPTQIPPQPSPARSRPTSTGMKT